MTPSVPQAAPLPLVRCAIYTRKSTEEGLEQSFNSLDAQREAALAYIHSQQHAGWQALPERYDDGGFSGGTLQRPALQRLLADVTAGKLDCVVVYKVDRLSRCLRDFAQLMAVLEQHRVAFVSVTQQFHTATPMGRLVLHILLSFAQFERELIAERTRDKLAAARRKGHWVGGMPLLGYDVDPHGSQLVVNAAEAQQVRAIFALYREYQALPPVAVELARRGWVSKRWLTRKGRQRGGQPFTPRRLRRLLTNPLYRGLIRYRSELHPGEHAALIEGALWDAVQALLQQPAPARASRAPEGYRAWLRGRLFCAACGCAMTPRSTTKGSKQYRYYVCAAAQQRGWQTCPAPALPAGLIEHLVLEQLCKRYQAAAEENDATVWDTLPPAEQLRLAQHLLQGVTYDAVHGQVSITFAPAGLPRRASELALPTPESDA
jgi:site-specific DNA recombinase